MLFHLLESWQGWTEVLRFVAPSEVGQGVAELLAVRFVAPSEVGQDSAREMGWRSDMSLVEYVAVTAVRVVALVVVLCGSCGRVQ
jgi:hypothetical protein